MSAESRSECSHQIADRLADWLVRHPEIRTLAVFAALPGEPDLKTLHATSNQTALVYPLVGAEHRLSFHRVMDPGTLVAGSFGIMEPSPADHPEVAVGGIDAFLCPGLGFDGSGTRLGRGGGFYDRALEGARPDAPRGGQTSP